MLANTNVWRSVLSNSMYVQGYQQRLRLQRRLYGIFLVPFLHSGFLAGQTSLISVVNN